MEPALTELLGDSTPYTTGFGNKLTELGPVVLESARSQAASIADPLIGPTAPEELVDEFGALPHIAIETRFSVSETEAFLLETLLTLDDAKTLFGIEFTPGDEIALQSARKSSGGITDLLALMLFTDSPIHGEIRVTEARYDNIEETIGIITDVSQGATLLRIEYDLVQESSRAHVTHIVPVTLLTAPAMHSGSVAPAAAATAAPTAAATAAANESDDLPDDIFDGIDDVDVAPAIFAPFETVPSSDFAPPSGMDLIIDVTLRVSVELGRAHLTVQEVLALAPGSVVELDKLAGEPVDIFVNDRLIARGEVVVVDEHFGVRVTQITAPSARRIPAGV